MQTQIHMQLVIRGVRLPAPGFCKGDHCSNRTTECTLWNCPLLLNASDVCAILYGYVCATKYYSLMEWSAYHGILPVKHC